MAMTILERGLGYLTQSTSFKIDRCFLYFKTTPAFSYRGAQQKTGGQVGHTGDEAHTAQ